MARKCLTCSHALRNEIDALIMQGSSFKWLERWCSDRGYEITETSLRRHAEKHIVGYEKPKTYEKKDAPTKHKLKEILPEPIILNFAKYCEEIGLDPTSLDDAENVVGAGQKGIALAFFKELGILNEKLNAFAKGETRHPTELIRGVRQLFDVFAKCYGIENVVDENAAFTTLESLGYTVQRTIDIERAR